MYCTQVLHLSEHAAYGRIQAARAVRKFPVLLEALDDGSVNLTTVVLLAAHLTAENHREVLDMARHQSKRAVEELVARLRPQPDVPTSVRKLPTKGHTEASPPAPHFTMTSTEPTGDGQVVTTSDMSPAVTVPRARPATVTPLAPQRYKVLFTASADTYQKLRLAQALLRHQIPDGDPAKIFDRALTALLEDLAKKKLAATDRPRRSRGTAAGSRHIPAEVKRAVWLRDGGQCAFVSQKGRRCAEQGFLEFHHVAPHATGCEPSAENIQLRCRAHNGYEAELYFRRRSAARVREARAIYPHATEQAQPSSRWGITAATRSGPSRRLDWVSAVRPIETTRSSNWGTGLISRASLRRRRWRLRGNLESRAVTQEPNVDAVRLGEEIQGFSSYRGNDTAN